MRISDWSSDVCSSDLMVGAPVRRAELAPAIVGVLLMMRLQRRKEVELERDARMARRHDAMGDELAAGRRTEMAVDANHRAHHRVLELIETRRQFRQMLAPHFAVGIRVRPTPTSDAGTGGKGGV